MKGDIGSWNFGAIQAIFLQLSWSQHKLAHSCQGRGQRSNGAINRNKHFFRSFCLGISNFVTPSLTVAELFQKAKRWGMRGNDFLIAPCHASWPPPTSCVCGGEGAAGSPYTGMLGFLAIMVTLHNFRDISQNSVIMGEKNKYGRHVAIF